MLGNVASISSLFLKVSSGKDIYKQESTVNVGLSNPPHLFLTLEVLQ